MARDGEQQAMTSERLAEIEHQQHQMAHDGHAKLSNELFLTVAVSDLLAEVERRRAREAALEAAEAERARWRDWVADVLGYIPVTASQPGLDALKEQARVLLASADSVRSGGDGA